MERHSNLVVNVLQLLACAQLLQGNFFSGKSFMFDSFCFLRFNLYFHVEKLHGLLPGPHIVTSLNTGKYLLLKSLKHCLKIALSNKLIVLKLGLKVLFVGNGVDIVFFSAWYCPCSVA